MKRAKKDETNSGAGPLTVAALMVIVLLNLVHGFDDVVLMIGSAFVGAFLVYAHYSKQPKA
jgi:hypothetical protein